MENTQKESKSFKFTELLRLYRKILDNKQFHKGKKFRVRIKLLPQYWGNLEYAGRKGNYKRKLLSKRRKSKPLLGIKIKMLWRINYFHQGKYPVNYVKG